MSSSTNTRGLDCAARLLAPVAIWAMALLVWPPLDHPFSAPKVAALAVAGLVARALVDFPLHRPAESCLFAVLVSLAFGAVDRAQPAAMPWTLERKT